MKLLIISFLLLFCNASGFASDNGEISGDLAQVLAKIAAAAHMPILAEIDAVGPVISIPRSNPQSELSRLRSIYPKLHVSTIGTVLHAWTDRGKSRSKLATVYKTYQVPSTVQELNTTLPTQIMNSKKGIATQWGAYSGFGNPELAQIPLRQEVLSNVTARQILLETLEQTTRFGVIFVADQQHFYFFPLSDPTLYLRAQQSSRD